MSIEGFAIGSRASAGNSGTSTQPSSARRFIGSVLAETHVASD
jgi:hypothetical protein